MSITKIGNKEFDIQLIIDKKTNKAIGGASFGFSITDSIFSLFPQCKIIYSDFLGLMKETGIFVSGRPFEISIEVEDSLLKIPYIVNNYTSGKPTGRGRIDGTMTILGIHEWYEKQNCECKAYKNSIDKIISEIITYDFGKKEIESTANSQIWYRNYLKESEFIKRLLKYAFSGSKKTSYLAYVNSQNEFQFQSIEKLFMQTEIETIKIDSSQALSYDTDLDARLRTSSWINYSNNRDVIFYYIDKEGNLKKDNKKLKDQMSFIQGKIPLIQKNKNMKSQSMVFLGTEKSDTAFQDNYKGLENWQFLDSIPIERMELITMMKPKLVAGKTIKLEVNSYIDKGDQGYGLNLFQSDKWLIEKSKHDWDTRNGFTTLSLIRPVAKNVPSGIQSEGL
jgi:hypothetical protein